MRTLGTILPTAQSEKHTNEWYAQTERKKLKVAADNNLGSFVMVGGERRYYGTSQDEYAIVSRNLKVLRFRETKDGDFAITN